MPNLPKHIQLAKLSSSKINLHIISKNIGYFLLGSTSPDMHVISKENREQYHFSTLSVNKIGTGVENILIKYPELKNIREQNSETQAFFAGYISHLIADEMWINKIFRPYFGNKSIYNDEIFGLLMDRAVQLDKDKEAWPVLNNSLICIRTASKSLNIKLSPTLFAPKICNAYVTSPEPKDVCKDVKSELERFKFIARTSPEAEVLAGT